MYLTDLECDYINPYDSASSINVVILPQYLTQALLCLTFLFTEHWFFCLFSLPCLYYNLTLDATDMVCKTMTRYLQRRHLVDVTEIYNQLQHEKQQRLFKLGFLVLLLVLCIFWFSFDNWRRIGLITHLLLIMLSFPSFTGIAVVAMNGDFRHGCIRN